ncbi:hypothetical protein A6J40_02050 [Legionella longbeachae]|uniref:hypothetical protein n=1 Tax=Legionella longbeachae TaxID=450 RepID=UPI0009B7A605|nr:hypothetical protein [Legionella longbeachae]VEE02695.1 Uncharacterised protein [Legionella oakridgensis]ARB91041.1 hypothetical protein A6J40_02050 [Legionella longbeachae]ARM32532.1 hypothetical protein B0B39_02865 [Legionella longbeachae]RZV21168.1 hypothetical protein EKG34_17090 [Legionella longbeachae]UAK45759.1 hypothetical protein K8O86_13315 [Legionella longbeachae]
MKASYRDHLKSKFKPTFFGLFETQYDSLLKNVSAYIYNDTVYNPPAITGCRGPVSGGYKNITLAQIQGEFDAYGYDPKLQAELLARIEKYVVDFEASTVFIPTQEQSERLFTVRNYFRDHIKEATANTIHNDSIYTPR